MLALIRFSDAFYLVVPKHFFNSVYKPTRYKSPPPPPHLKAYTKPLMKLYKPRTLKWDFAVQKMYENLARGLDIRLLRELKRNSKVVYWKHSEGIDDKRKLFLIGCTAIYKDGDHL